MSSITLFLFVARLLFFQAPPTAPAPDTYTLGAGDQIVVRAPAVEEIDNKPVPEEPSAPNPEVLLLIVQTTL